MMSGHDDERFIMGLDAEVTSLMFPVIETPLDMADMDLDEAYSLGNAIKEPEFQYTADNQLVPNCLKELPIGQPDVTDVEFDLNLQWNMPSQTSHNDMQAETGQSPAFTMELNMYFDTHSSVFPDTEGPPTGTPDVGSLFTHEDQNDIIFSGNRSIFGANSINGVSPESSGQPAPVQRVPSLASISRNRAISLSERMENTYLQPHPDRYYGKQTQTIPSLFSEGARGLMHLLPAELPHQNGQSPEGFARTNTYLDTPDASTHGVHRLRDNSSYRTSLMGQANELLPLTTNTSLTPSAASIHLNQPSFVSAQQYMRPLMEQPPSGVNRGSFDMYTRYGMTPESLSLGTPPVRTQRSFASYFSFMDKDRKQPDLSSVEIDHNYEELQPRTLIRSIFKGSNQSQQQADANTNPEQMATYNATFDENMLSSNAEDDVNQYSSPKATKRVKKGIFDRFKPNKPNENAQENRSDVAMTGEVESDNLDLSWAKTNQSVTSQQNVSRRSSTLNSGNNSLGGSLKLQNSAGLDTSKALEPNYGALFKGVAKRRTIVSMNGKKKTQAQIKKEIMVEEAILDNLSPSKSKLVSIKQEDLSLSPLSSQFSSTSQDPDIDSPGFGQGTLATASKRILGSRLLKRKGSASIKQETHPSNLVEVDLLKLDLPVNTEVLSDSSLRSRPRGRREDKQADLVDETKIYICGYCSRRFKRQEHLKRHFRSLHTAEKPYDCPKCQKKFSRTDNLNQHLKVHKLDEKSGNIKEEETEEIEDEKSKIIVKTET